jgi:hypothetical protein
MPPAEYAAAMDRRERQRAPKWSAQRGAALAELYPGTYHLVSIDEEGRRSYARTPLEAPAGGLAGGGEAAAVKR